MNLSKEEYWKNQSPARTGFGGDAETYRLICQYIAKYKIELESEVLIDMASWNAICTPPWPKSRLKRKIKDAMKFVKKNSEWKCGYNPWKKYF